MDEERARVRRARRGRRARRAAPARADLSGVRGDVPGRRAARTSGTTRSTSSPTGSIRPSASARSPPASSRCARRTSSARSLIVAALAVAAATGRWQTVGVVALYMAVTLTYSAIWKHIAVVDLVAIASGFVLRAAAGAVAVDVPMSSWFVLVHHVRFAVHRDRQAVRRVARARRRRPQAAVDAGRLQRGLPAVRAGAGVRRGAGQLLHVGVRAQGTRRTRPTLLRAVDRARC